MSVAVTLRVDVRKERVEPFAIHLLLGLYEIRRGWSVDSACRTVRHPMDAWAGALTKDRFGVWSKVRLLNWDTSQTRGVERCIGLPCIARLLKAPLNSSHPSTSWIKVYSLCNNTVTVSIFLFKKFINYLLVTFIN